MSLVALLLGCAPDQLLVFVDIDAPVPSQIDRQEQEFEARGWANAIGLSPDSMVDTLRIDILGAAGEPLDACEVLAPAEQNWPLSFGVPKGEHIKYVRLRAFQRTFAQPADAHGFRHICGKPVADDTDAVLSEPPPEVTIDRVFAMPPDVHSERRIALTLTLSCMGDQSLFLSQRTCVGGNSLPPSRVAFDDPSQFQDVEAAPPSRVGSSALAQDVPCTAAKPSSVPAESVVCVPGGFSIQGDLRFQDEYTLRNPAPLRAVYVSPMYFDKTEVSVGRFKEILSRAGARGVSIGEPHPGTDFEDCTVTDCSSFERYNCTWKLPGHGDDRLPVNCLHFSVASAACSFLGGTLPSESQWEHAARGRGRRWSYAWGSTRPDVLSSLRCCKSAVGRSVWTNNTSPPPELPVPEYRCAEAGPAPVGTYTNERCPDGGDVSIDGVLDMTGNVAEYVRDGLRPYSDRCGLTGGVTRDPVCLMQSRPARYQRRGTSFFFSDDLIGHSAQRSQVHGGFAPNGDLIDAAQMDTGFRCAYKGALP